MRFKEVRGLTLPRCRCRTRSISPSCSLKSEDDSKATIQSATAGQSVGSQDSSAGHPCSIRHLRRNLDLLIQPLVITRFGPSTAFRSFPFQSKSDDLWRERERQGQRGQVSNNQIPSSHFKQSQTSAEPRTSSTYLRLKPAFHLKKHSKQTSVII